ncbi:8-oxoguanine DNA-glycosylase (Ogg) [Subdoligranulum sp. CAG:314]|jgi:3-methyladenine DNA glycosylase/8-oxoguanine DNA glycosylase|nr:DNA-3-methyladenine glycosylase 2 family protein [Subdoligranulum sp.]CDE71289.1 8-oxoguanine DNA-glycosylase (Ogg) [Subdoligranulum sp. CAG:314]
MKAQKTENGITVLQADCFNPRDILECGQIFRFDRDGEGNYRVFSLDRYAEIKKTNDGYFISTDSPDYFYDFFDLDRDYGVICEKLSSSYDVMKRAVEFGRGIRILRQNLEEMIFSFIISANNNIKRIQLIIGRICEALGEKTPFGYAFPSVKKLAEVSSPDFYFRLGAGYRAPYIYETANALKDGFELDRLKELDSVKARKALLDLKGVGAKVADCIMLFGLNRFDVFPVDTWVKKVYHRYFETGLKDSEISTFFVNTFGDLSGFAQQYLFYFLRTMDKGGKM